MSSRAARTLAHAIRKGADRHAERHGPSVYRATITALDPFGADLHGTDLSLDADDVTYAQAVTAYDTATGLAVGDELTLVEIKNAPFDVDYVAVGVVPHTEAG